ncbi:hypothetical protein ACFL1U_01050 [Patescibacteria group bacterium]
MSLDFIAVAPHAPELLPSASEDHKLKTDITRQSLDSLRAKIQAIKPEIVAVVQPPRPENHNLDTLVFANSDQLSGNLAAFGDEETALVFHNHQDLVEEIRRNAKSLGIPTTTQHETSISPFTFITLMIIGCCQKTDDLPQIIMMEHSENNFSEHWLAGEMLGHTLHARPEKIALIASTDLANKMPAASAEYLEQSEHFDITIIEALRDNNPAAIRNLDSTWAKKIGETGLRALCVAWAAAKVSDPDIKPHLLSYESPFGTGYLTVDLSPHK